MKSIGAINKFHFIMIRLALIVGLFILMTLLIFFENDTAPNYDELSIFIGKIDDISHNSKTHKIRLSLTNSKDKITVQIPGIWKCEIEKKLTIGQNVEIRYFRQNFMSGIDAWSIKSNEISVISYDDFAKNISHSAHYQDLHLFVQKATTPNK